MKKSVVDYAQLEKWGIFQRNSSLKCADVFSQITPISFPSEVAHEQIAFIWQKYNELRINTPNLNGAVFEIALAIVFLIHDIKPIHYQSKVVFVPNVEFDLVLYSKAYGPISISAKTSLRERYKQADLEAVSLKYVHRKAKAYLITLDENEALRVGRKVKTGDLLGIDEVVLATSVVFDQLVQFLKNEEFEDPKPVPIITSKWVFGNE